MGGAKLHTAERDAVQAPRMQPTTPIVSRVAAPAVWSVPQIVDSPPISTTPPLLLAEETRRPFLALLRTAITAAADQELDGQWPSYSTQAH